MPPLPPRRGVFTPQQEDAQIIPPGQDSIPVDVPPPSGQLGPMGGAVDPRTGMPAPPLPAPPQPTDGDGMDIQGAEDVVDQEFSANLADQISDQERFGIAD